MGNNMLLTELTNILGEDNVKVQEPMNRHTTFKIGGPADYFVTPYNIEQLTKLIKLLNDTNTDFFILGNGSNLLVNDTGYRGVIIQLLDKFNDYEIKEPEIKEQKISVKAQAGVMLSKLGYELAAKAVTGFEFATGIPGTIGGAVMMNAGAYGGEIKDIIVNATVMDKKGKISVLTNEELKLGYRSSIIKEKDLIVLEAEFELKYGDKEEIMAKVKELALKRKEKQPLNYPSAGSTFKRPVGYFAGKLISDAGLKGFSVGGAQVSEKHAGFVINTGNATAKDVIDLTDEVERIVFEEYGVELELEVRKLGFF